MVQILMSMMVQAHEGVMGRGEHGRLEWGRLPEDARGTQVGDVIGRSGGSEEKEARWVVFKALRQAVGS